MARADADPKEVRAKVVGVWGHGRKGDLRCAGHERQPCAAEIAAHRVALFWPGARLPALQVLRRPRLSIVIRWTLIVQL